jgi:hypothetical protein
MWVRRERYMRSYGNAMRSSGRKYSCNTLIQHPTGLGSSQWKNSLIRPPQAVSLRSSSLHRDCLVSGFRLSDSLPIVFLAVMVSI